jgi:hypothetical protein
MNKGTCKLCLQPDKDLRDSHFMPRSLYALCRTDEYEPVHFSRDAVYPTSRQTKYPLFCGECEQLLSREGESWVLPLLPTLGGPFPLRERLMKQVPIYQDAEKALYATAANGEIDVSKLMHFAVGLFYKAAVHSWVGGSTEPCIFLGDDDTETLRLYLLGQAKLQRHMALCVAVDSSQVILPAIIDPYRGSNPEFRNYLFYVPGMAFHLFIGGGVQEKMAANCINSNPACPVLIEELSKDMRNITREQVANARRTKKLSETTAEIEARGLNVRLDD